MGAALMGPIFGALAGSVVSSLFAPKHEQQQTPAAAAPAVAAPAAAVSPSIGAFSSNNAASALSGPSSTSLSGVGGIDPSILKLGKNTILGA